jgi:hypothetical protein
MRRVLPILGLWCALALGLSVLTTRVRDWFAMLNEMLYERRAISIAQSISPLPRIRGEFVSTFDQLYPALIAPAFRWGDVPHDLWIAHALNAWIMSSACIPAYLLARRVTATPWIAYVVAVLTVVMPWIVLSSFLLTEVAAYPAFVWALLAMHASTAEPSRRHDVLALLAIGVAFAGRTQLALLLLVLPVAILALELGRSGSLRRAVRTAVAGHRVLAWAYGILAVAALVLGPLGRLPGVLGVYGATIGGTGSSVGEGFGAEELGRSLAEHASTFSLGLGILPLVVGAAWLLANLVRPSADRELHAFACLGALTLITLLAQVTVFDLRFGDDFVHDRYLFYLVPVVVLAFLCAVRDRRSLRWSLVAPTAVIVLGFTLGALPGFTWQQFATVNSDAPIAAFYRPIVAAFGSLGAARAALALVTVALAALFALAYARLSRRWLARLSAGFALLVVPALTVYMLERVLGHDGWSGRPLTATPAYDWVDGLVGGANVAMAPYPVSTAYFVNQRVWRDLEFWNKSVDREVQQPERSFVFTSDTFPKLYPRFDPADGRSDVSPASFVLQADQETRFRIAGTVRLYQEGVSLIEAAKPWRLDWLGRGLYPDGWTRPHTPARVRVFAVPGQRTPVTRTLSLAFQTPEGVGRRDVRVSSNVERAAVRALGARTVREALSVCVPAGGHADVRMSTRGVSEIPPDLRYSGSDTRFGGVLVSEVALADEIGPRCRPSG